MKHLLKLVSFSCLILFFQLSAAQELKLKPRKTEALGGKAFAKSILDSTLTLQKREEIIFQEIKNGNVPDFLRKLVKITDSSLIQKSTVFVTYHVLPDYLSIGSNEDFFYVPMTPILAQRIATLLKSSLPTKKIVDVIYQNAKIKLRPQPLLPSKAMTTVALFITHNDSISTALAPYKVNHLYGQLTAGTKKDIIVSNKIYTEKTAKVVIYGWHRLNGKAIQPVYNKHTNLWADYSHGVRLVQQKILINGKKSSMKKLLNDPLFNLLLSDEGQIAQPFYPITTY